MIALCNQGHFAITFDDCTLQSRALVGSPFMIALCNQGHFAGSHFMIALCNQGHFAINCDCSSATQSKKENTTKHDKKS